MTIFPTPRISDTESLYKQLLPFHRPTGGKTGGKKPALPVGPAIDISTPDSHSTPNIGSDQEEDRPLKRRRMSGGEEDVMMNGVEGDESISAKKGKKPSGKTTGRKERMPRTVVRSARGLVPMETEADGTQHVGGQLPDTVLQDGAAAVATAEGDGEEEEVPLAQQRPQLEEGERKRREIAKEKEKEREVEVLRNQRREDVEIWEGVELVRYLLIFSFSFLEEHLSDDTAKATTATRCCRGSGGRNSTYGRCLQKSYPYSIHPPYRPQEPFPKTTPQNAARIHHSTGTRQESYQYGYRQERMESCGRDLLSAFRK